MTTINDIADLVRVLQENPEWLITLRGVIISDDLATVPASLKEINRRLDNLQTELTTVGGRVSNLTGRDYAGFAARYAPRHMDLPGEIASITLLYQEGRHNDLWLPELANSGVLQGNITRDEANELNTLDLVFEVSHQNGDTTLLAAEVSITVDHHDVERAARRRAILARIQPLAVTPVTIGGAIDQDARELCAVAGVTHVVLETHHTTD